MRFFSSLGALLRSRRGRWIRSSNKHRHWKQHRRDAKAQRTAGRAFSHSVVLGLTLLARSAKVSRHACVLRGLGLALQISNEKAPRIRWYRCPIDPAKLRELTKRSDAKGLFYSMGNLLLLAATGYAAFYFFARDLWLGFALALWLHGTVRSVAGSAHHELAHGTVFKSKWLSALFLRLSVGRYFAGIC